MSRTSAHSRPPKTERIALRASERQQDVIRRAAAATDRSVTDFIMDSAVARAEKVLADRRWFSVTDAQWAEFTELLDRPLPSTERFRTLLERPSPFADPE
jgi:uncharacterized protein (DUF1778 family)